MFADEEAVLAALAVETDELDPLMVLEAIRDARQDKESPVARLLDSVAAPKLTALVAHELGIEFVDLFSETGLASSGQLLERTDLTWLERFVAIPLLAQDNSVVVAAANPQDLSLNDYLAVAFPEGFRTVMASSGQIRQMLLTASSAAAAANFAEEGALDEVVNVPGQASPVLAWVEATLASTIAQGSSDLHFELTDDGRMLSRYRVDNDLVAQTMPLRGRELEVISALMSRAAMDSANVREPQDGNFSFVAAGRRIDVRASMIPTVHGPKLVLRLLDPANLRSLYELGFGPEALDVMNRATQLSQGLIIVAGPTGSGKTTTLYAMLREIADVSKNVMTIENPVEYRLPYVSQVQVRSDLGDRSVTFNRALRTILRSDPDVILVGEVRDAETARVAIDAALTGHLVLTTVHAPSAAGVFVRLIEMGLPPYLVAESLTLSISQRLVRKVHSCREIADMPAEIAVSLADVGLEPPGRMAVPVGCPTCAYRGYRGRIAVAELVIPDDATRRAVILDRSADGIEESAEAAASYVPAAWDLNRLLDGNEITPAEALRVASGSTL